jgi:hypothetical protein
MLKTLPRKTVLYRTAVKRIVVPELVRILRARFVFFTREDVPVLYKGTPPLRSTLVLALWIRGSTSVARWCNRRICPYQFSQKTKYVDQHPTITAQHNAQLKPDVCADE